MASAIHRVTYAYYPSVNTPDFPVEHYVINPDLTGVAGVPQQYWKVVGDAVVEMTTEEKEAVDAVMFRASLVTLNKTQADGISKITLAPRTGSEANFTSHNFADPCEWYQGSSRISEETLTDSGDGLTFNSANEYWIDAYSGRIHNQETWKVIQQMMNPGDPHAYQVKITADDVELTQCAPFSETDADYWVDWRNGKVTFTSSQSGKVIKAWYSKANLTAEGSKWTLMPLSPTSSYQIETSELDYSVAGTVMNDALVYRRNCFDAEVGANDEAIRVFHRTSGIFKETLGPKPLIRAVGASDADVTNYGSDIDLFRRKSRGMRYDWQPAPFFFGTMTLLCPVRGAGANFMSFHLANGVPFGGENVTVSLYVTFGPTS